MGALPQYVAPAVHDPFAGRHFRARLAARMDRDHRHFRADFPSAPEALQHRPSFVGCARVREFAGGLLVTAGGDVGLLSEGRLAQARHVESDLRRHDALHAGHHSVYGCYVLMAGHDALAAELPLRRMRMTQSDPTGPTVTPVVGELTGGRPSGEAI